MQETGIRRRVRQRVKSINDLVEFTRDKDLLDKQSRTMLILIVEDFIEEVEKCAKLLKHALWFADTLAEIAGVEIIPLYRGEEDKEEEEIS